MKIIEALKKVKYNREKILDLQKLIYNNSSRLSNETSPYEDPQQKIQEWSQSCIDLSNDCVKLLSSISKTNLQTEVTIEIGGNQITRSIAEWVIRRREFSNIDLKTFSLMSDKGLKEGTVTQSNGETAEVTIVRHYNPENRDNKVKMYSEERYLIDSKLEVVNATTDIIE